MWIPAQDPIVRRTAISEMVAQLIILGGIVAIVRVFGNFELAILTAIVLGFSLNTLNVIGSATGQNVHIAEIRELLLKFKNSSKG